MKHCSGILGKENSERASMNRYKGKSKSDDDDGRDPKTRIPSFTSPRTLIGVGVLLVCAFLIMIYF